MPRRRSTGVGCTTDTVRTPVERSAVFIAPHCQLMYELGCQQAIRGVCDLDYINIPDVRKRAASAGNAAAGKASAGNASSGNAAAGNSIVDCGSSMAPDIERIIALKPEAILVSPFENSGGYGKLDKLHIPIIEAADYMESSPLGRAEWMKFYGMLFKKDGNAPKTALAASCEPKADSLFAKIEKEYLKLKAEADGLSEGPLDPDRKKNGQRMVCAWWSEHYRYSAEGCQRPLYLRGRSAQRKSGDESGADLWRRESRWMYGHSSISVVLLCRRLSCFRNMTATRLLLPSTGVISIR